MHSINPLPPTTPQTPALSWSLQQRFDNLPRFRTNMPPNQLIKRRFSFSIGVLSTPKWSKNPVPVEYCVTVSTQKDYLMYQLRFWRHSVHHWGFSCTKLIFQIKNRGVKQRALRLRVAAGYRHYPNNVCSGCGLSQPCRNVLACRLAPGQVWQYPPQWRLSQDVGLFSFCILIVRKLREQPSLL